MARTTNGTRKPSRGGQLLEKTPDHERDTGDRLDVSPSLVAHWKSGLRKPTNPQRATLKAVYGIPTAAWDEAPSSKPARVKPRRSSNADAAAAGSLPPGEENATTDVERLRRYIREGMRSLEFEAGLSGVKRAEALKKLVDAQVALDKSTGANALTMSRILAHPDFKHAVQTITDAIAPYPEALAATLKALQAVTEKGQRG